MIQKPPVRRVLVTRLRFMGDVILTTPVLHALRRADPECKIGYLSEKRYSVLLDGHPDVDWNFGLERGWKEFLSMIRNLRAKRFDAVVDLFGNPRSAWIVWLSGAGCRIGGDYRGRKYFYTKRIPDDGIVRSAIDYHLRFLEPLGIQALPSSTRIVLRDSELMDAERLLADFGYRKKPGRPLVGINPGATWPAKRWPPERFAELADRLVAERDAEVVLTYGPGEEDIVKRVETACHSRISRIPLLGIRPLAALIRLFDVYVSNDCGPMHIGPAVRTPTVGIFGPEKPEIWFPYESSEGHQSVYEKIACSRCHKEECERMDCIRAISVEQVWKATEGSLATKKRNRTMPGPSIAV